MNEHAVNLHYLPGPKELARYAAEELIALLICRADTSVPFTIALSGGRIAGAFYDEIIAAAQRSTVSFANVHFFWADERCVPPEDAESNYRIAREHLFDPLRIDVRCIHRVRGEGEFAKAAADAAADLCEIAPRNAAGVPLLDLVVLGMGEDGHVASLFPSEGHEWIEHPDIYRHVVAVKPPPNRITLGYQPLIQARNAWVLASGSSKVEIFKKVLAGEDLPLNRVIARRGMTALFQDFWKPPRKNV